MRHNITKNKTRKIHKYFELYQVVWLDSIVEWLDSNDMLMHLTHNDGKSVIVERILRTLKTKIYKKWQLIVVNLIFLI